MNWIAVKVSFCLTSSFHHQRHTTAFHCTRRKKSSVWLRRIWVSSNRPGCLCSGNTFGEVERTMCFGDRKGSSFVIDDNVWRHLTWMCLGNPLCTAQHHNHSYNCIECWLTNPSCAVQIRQHALIRHRFRIKSSNMTTELVDLLGLPPFQDLNQSGSTGVTAAESL